MASKQKSPTYILLIFSLHVEHAAMWYGISLVCAGFSYSSCVPYQYLVHPQPPRLREGWGAGKALGFCKYLSTTRKTFSCHQHPKIPKHISLLATIKKIIFYPAKPSAVSYITGYKGKSIHWTKWTFWDTPTVHQIS